MYEITKLFIDGLLKGITITERTNVKFAKNFVCNNPIAGSAYKIIDIKTITE